MLARFHGALMKLHQLDAVTVAAVDGHCLGGGMELAAVCDLVLASERSRFGQPEIRLGCYPPLAAALYPSLLGPALTADLLLTGRTLDCAEAERLGFVARRVADDGFEPALETLVAELLEKSGAVLRLTKKAIRAGRGNRFQKALGECEHVYLQELAATSDMEEGVRAFLEKRPPTWRHR
jgi:cyclohexa-1,5-dienecarbonyl-CoA hydratase